MILTFDWSRLIQFNVAFGNRIYFSHFPPDCLICQVPKTRKQSYFHKCSFPRGVNWATKIAWCPILSKANPLSPEKGCYKVIQTFVIALRSPVYPGWLYQLVLSLWVTISGITINTPWGVKLVNLHNRANTHGVWKSRTGEKSHLSPVNRAGIWKSQIFPWRGNWWNQMTRWNVPSNPELSACLSHKLKIPRGHWQRSPSAVYNRDHSPPFMNYSNFFHIKNAPRE